jgi:tetratricopeptide (TPR) repeat protein
MRGLTNALGPTEVAEPAVPPHRSRIILGGGIIVLAALAVYYNCFVVPFILDDPSSVASNASIRHLWPIWDALSPPANSVVGGRPVLNLTLAVNYALGGTAVWGYHAVNLAIHILSGLTLYGVVRRTLSHPPLRGRFGVSAMRLALAVAVLWTVHPLQTEAVTYVSERAESLMGMFYLLTLYCFIRGTESPRSAWWFTLSVVACLLGMGSKEVMVTAPLMVLLYDRTFVSGSLRGSWTRHRWLHLGLTSTWLLLGYLMTGLHYHGVGYGLGITWWAYSLTECRTVIRYLWLALWPHPLVFDYGQFAAIQHIAQVAPYALILAVLLAGTLFELRRQPAIGFVGAWFFMILAPTSSLVPVLGQPMAEHRMYLSLAAVVVLGVMGVHVLIGRRTVAVVVALAIALGVLTWRRNQDYSSEIAIWDDAVAKCPQNPRAHTNLGIALSQAGRLPEAIEHLEQALRINPDYDEAHNNLGNALTRSGRLPEAIEHLEQALRITPDLAEAHNNLGAALERAGRLQDALGHYEQALRINPDLAVAHCNLGNALTRSGRLPEAIEHLEQALRIKPDYAEAHTNLGIALGQAGRLPEAIEQLEQALRINPDLAEAHTNLGIALERVGRLQDAIGHYEQALRIKPDLAPAKNALARLQGSQ